MKDRLSCQVVRGCGLPRPGGGVGFLRALFLSCIFQIPRPAMMRHAPSFPAKDGALEASASTLHPSLPALTARIQQYSLNTGHWVRLRMSRLGAWGAGGEGALVSNSRAFQPPPTHPHPPNPTPMQSLGPSSAAIAPWLDHKNSPSSGKVVLREGVMTSEGRGFWGRQLRQARGLH